MRVIISVIFCGLFFSSAHAAGWDYVRRHPSILGTSKCPFGMTSHVASFYGRGDGFHGRPVYCQKGKGQPRVLMNASELTFASNFGGRGPGVPCGEWRTFHNPQTGRTVSAQSTDYGPFGEAHALGARFDLSDGTRRALGMKASQRICVGG